jgi:uncharacterized membrane protein
MVALEDIEKIPGLTVTSILNNDINNDPKDISNFNNKNIKNFGKKNKCYVAFDGGVYNFTNIKKQLNENIKDFADNILFDTINNDESNNIGIIKNDKQNEIKSKLYNSGGFGLECGTYRVNDLPLIFLKNYIRSKLNLIYFIKKNEAIYISDTSNNDLQGIIDDLKKLMKNDEELNIIIDDNYIGEYKTIYNKTIFSFSVLSFVIILITLILIKSLNFKMIYLIIILCIIFVYFFYKNIYKKKKIILDEINKKLNNK